MRAALPQVSSPSRGNGAAAQRVVSEGADDDQPLVDSHRDAESVPTGPVGGHKMGFRHPMRPASSEDVHRAGVDTQRIVAVGAADRHLAADGDLQAEQVAGGAVRCEQLGLREPARAVGTEDVGGAGERAVVIIAGGSDDDSASPDCNRQTEGIIRRAVRGQELAGEALAGRRGGDEGDRRRDGRGASDGEQCAQEVHGWAPRYVGLG